MDKPSLTLAKTEVVENETVSLMCSVLSNPTAELIVRNVDNETVVVDKETNNLKFSIPRVKCLHNGSFICVANNRAAGILYSDTRELNVLCFPRHDYRKPLVDVVSSGLNEVASLALSVISNPPPVYTWYLYANGQMIPIPNVTIHNIISTIQKTVLQIQQTHSRDYGSYTVVAENRLGKVEAKFTLKPLSPPRPPNEFTVVNIRTKGVSLRWKSNKNGGSTQTFTTEFGELHGTWETWTEGITDPGEGKLVTTDITNLLPATHYQFRVHAVNRYGESENVNRDAKTEGTTSSTSDRLGMGIGIGVAGTLPIFICVLVAVVVCLRRQIPAGKKAGPVSNEENELNLESAQYTSNQSIYTDLSRISSTGNEYEQLQVQADRDSSKVYQNVVEVGV